MKRLIFLFAILLMGSMSIFAQEVEPPGDVWEIFMNLRVFLGSIFGAFALLMFLTPLVIGALHLEGKFIKYLMTTVVTAVVVLVCYFVDFGYLYGNPWYTILLNVVGLMLAQIGIFAIQFIKDILEYPNIISEVSSQ